MLLRRGHIFTVTGCFFVRVLLNICVLLYQEDETKSQSSEFASSSSTSQKRSQCNVSHPTETVACVKSFPPFGTSPSAPAKVRP